MLNLATHWPLQFGPHSVTGGSFTQAGSGDPSPDNIRAITPWKAAGAATTVTRCGKNLLQNIGTTATVVDVTFTVNADKSVTVNGTAAAARYFLIGGGVAGAVPVPQWIIPGTTYVLKATGSADCWLHLSFNGGTTRNYVAAANKATFTYNPADGNTSYSIYVAIPSGKTMNNFTMYPQLEPGSTATAYEPYISKSATLAAPELYAGYMGDDWYWRRTWDKKTLSSTSGMTYSGEETDVAIFVGAVLTGGVAINANKIAVSHFKSAYDDTSDTEHARNLASNLPISLVVYINKTRLAGWDGGWTNGQKTAAFNTFLDAQITAGTPVTVAYQLATPVSIAPTIP